MAEWWLLDSQTQQRIADHIDYAAERVIDHFDAHRDENSLTAALSQELIREPIFLADTTVTFTYRNFAEQDEEPLVGADGGIVKITNRQETVEKGVLFQAKRLPQDRNTRSLSLKRNDASRLKRQITNMLNYTSESVVLGHTRNGTYAVDADFLVERTVDELRFPFQNARLVSFGAYLGKWVARCTRGDLAPSFNDGIRKPRGFLSHFLEMQIKTLQRPLLTEGGVPIDLSSLPRNAVPRSRWRRHNT